jgi:hypothetical protein
MIYRGVTVDFGERSLYIAFAIGLFFLAVPALAEEGQKILYQTSFSENPNWETNNPSGDYWDPQKGMYHFSLEPSTGNYAYTNVNYDRGSFILEYDLIINRIDEGAVFRMGLTGNDMDPTKGPNVLSAFTNAKYGKIMWLHVVTNSNKMSETNSQHAATELGSTAYTGDTAKYELDKLYHVTVRYNDDRKILSMKVTDTTTGRDIWSYYLNTWENLHEMDRIYLGSRGDYGTANTFAQGYIDNVVFSVPDTTPATPTLTPEVTVTAPEQTMTKKPTSARTSAIPTSWAAETQKSPLSPVPAFAAAGLVSMAAVFLARRKQ